MYMLLLSMAAGAEKASHRAHMWHGLKKHLTNASFWQQGVSKPSTSVHKSLEQVNSGRPANSKCIASSSSAQLGVCVRSSPKTPHLLTLCGSWGAYILSRCWACFVATTHYTKFIPLFRGACSVLLRLP